MITRSITHRTLFTVGLAIAAVACGSGASQSAQDKETQSHGLALLGHHNGSDMSLEPASVMGQPDRPITGPQGGVGQFVVECELSHVASDDPILYPGATGASHLHAFFGNNSTTALSTFEELLEASTSCENVQDTASYWVPVLIDQGEVIAPTYSVAYYRAGLGIDPASVQAYPPGLMMIAGDPTAVEPQPVSVVAWSCGNGSLREAMPPICPRRAGLHLDVTFPDCWDGENLNVPGHRGHVRYSNDGQCPDSHPVPIPQLIFSAIYPVFGDITQMRLASGSLLTGHADFVNSWNQDVLEREVELCLRRDNVCGIASGRIPI